MLRSGLTCGAVFLSAVVFCGGAQAERYRYKIIDVPGAAETKALYVNTQRQVAGSYVETDGTVRVFRYADGKSRKYAAPRPHRNADIVPSAIGPTGLIAGFYSVDGKVFPIIIRGLADGVEAIGYPTSDGEHDVTPTAISNNEKEDVAGYLTVGDGTIQGFDTQAGFTSWTGTYVPGASATKILAFAQDPVEGFEIPGGVYVTDRQHGFYGSSTTPIDPPGSVNTSLTYFNNGVRDNYEYGGYAESKKGKTFGWARRGTKYTIYKFPGATDTKVTRHIGDDVFGEYTDKAGKTHGFQYRDGRYYEVQTAYAEVTLTGVAEDGSLAGSFLGKDGRIHGYLATCASGPNKCLTGPEAPTAQGPAEQEDEIADAR